MNIDLVIMFTFTSDEQIHRIMELFPNEQRPFDIGTFPAIFQFVYCS